MPSSNNSLSLPSGIYIYICMYTPSNLECQLGRATPTIVAENLSRHRNFKLFSPKTLQISMMHLAPLLNKDASAGPLSQMRWMPCPPPPLNKLAASAPSDEMMIVPPRGCDRQGARHWSHARHAVLLPLSARRGRRAQRRPPCRTGLSPAA